MWKHFTVSELPYSWKYCTPEVKEHLLVCYATNDISESDLGGIIQQIQEYGNINKVKATTVSDTKYNIYLKCITPSKCKQGNGRRGLFCLFSKEIRDCIVLAAMECAPAANKFNNEVLKRQHECRHQTQCILEEKALEYTTEDTVDTIYYYRIYGLPVYWKGDPSIVDVHMRHRSRDPMHQVHPQHENNVTHHHQASCGLCNW